MNNYYGNRSLKNEPGEAVKSQKSMVEDMAASVNALVLNNRALDERLRLAGV